MEWMLGYSRFLWKRIILLLVRISTLFAFHYLKNFPPCSFIIYFIEKDTKKGAPGIFFGVFHLTWYCWKVFINQEISETMVQHGFNVCIHCTKAVTKGGLISEFFSILLKSSKNGNHITPLSTINLERTRTPLKPIWTDPSK